mgnify:CR=1 FL=1
MHGQAARFFLSRPLKEVQLCRARGESPRPVNVAGSMCVREIFGVSYFLDFV